MKKNNVKWFSIVIVLWLIIIINLIVIWILWYIVPFSKDTKWIENSSKAYYQANSWIEDVLYEIKWESVWYSTTKTLWTSSEDYWYSVISSWTLLPQVWQWNSEYDKDFNKIWIWDAIQLEVWNDDLDINNTDFVFKVPNFDWNDSTNEFLAWTGAIVNWQLSSDDNTLNAYESQVMADWVCESNETSCEIQLYNSQWRDLRGDSFTLWTFYNNNCTWDSCILKLSIINSLVLDDSNDTVIPYLEWKIDTNSPISLRYAVIETEWKSYWYKKALEIRIPQQTTNEAFDFTVFQ